MAWPLTSTFLSSKWEVDGQEQALGPKEMDTRKEGAGEGREETGMERARDTQSLRTKSKSLKDRSVEVQWQGARDRNLSEPESWPRRDGTQSTGTHRWGHVQTHGPTRIH